MAKCNQLTALPFKGLIRSDGSVCGTHSCTPGCTAFSWLSLHYRRRSHKKLTGNMEAFEMEFCQKSVEIPYTDLVTDVEMFESVSGRSSARSTRVLLTDVFPSVTISLETDALPRVGL